MYRTFLIFLLCDVSLFSPCPEPDWVKVSPLPGNMSCSCTATGSEEVEGVALVAAASVEPVEASAPRQQRCT